MNWDIDTYMRALEFVTLRHMGQAYGGSEAVDSHLKKASKVRHCGAFAEGKFIQRTSNSESN
ncbi:MAG: hypothetical protein E6Q34_09310 [Burkholderiaceae bacterium]|nr:MAG: hypothetical protein E6Q34_09310 [Burkholderiaceae bacterium]